jgi:hypothetical protein
MFERTINPPAQQQTTKWSCRAYRGRVMPSRDKALAWFDRATFCTMRKDYKVAVRVSVGFSQEEWDDIAAAVTICHRLKPEWGESFQHVSHMERGWWIRCAVSAVAKSVIRDGCDNHVPLACDVREETAEEYAQRAGEREQTQMPLNIIELPALSA